MEATALPATASPSDSRILAIGFAALSILTYILIVLGALVRANHAGLACPDWPLCFGEFVPEFDMQVAFEWGHRLMAGSIAVVFVLLAGLTLGDPARRSRMWGLLCAAALLLALQIVLGGLTVLQLLASWTVTSHLIVGNAFALALAFAAGRLFENPLAPAGADRPIHSGLRWLVTGCAGMLMAQMLLGGLVSSNYAGLVCPDWPACENGVFVPSLQGRVGLQLLHRFNSYGLLLALLGAAIASRVDETESGTPLKRLLTLGLGLCVVQVGVGVANVLLRLPVEVTGAHSGIAALMTLSLGLALREAWRRPILEIG